MDDTTAQQSAEQPFGSVNVHHRRRTRRLVYSAAAIAARPEKTFPQIFDGNALRAFYNLCAQHEATLPTLLGPHWQRTRQAMGQQPLVLIVHDTTDLDFTGHAALQGAGPLGDGGGQGICSTTAWPSCRNHVRCWLWLISSCAFASRRRQASIRSNASGGNGNRNRGCKASPRRADRPKAVVG